MLDFCFNCERIGHIAKHCHCESASADKNLSNTTQYGLWLRFLSDPHQSKRAFSPSNSSPRVPKESRSTANPRRIPSPKIYRLKPLPYLKAQANYFLRTGGPPDSTILTLKLEQVVFPKQFVCSNPKNPQLFTSKGSNLFSKQRHWSCFNTNPFPVCKHSNRSLFEKKEKLVA